MEKPFEHLVDIAVNGLIALDFLKKKKYDLVSLDYVLLGELTGTGVYHYIRHENKTLPVLFISGNREFIESIKELKVNDKKINYLSKPSRLKRHAVRKSQKRQKNLILIFFIILIAISNYILFKKSKTSEIGLIPTQAMEQNDSDK